MGLFLMAFLFLYQAIFQNKKLKTKYNVNNTLETFLDLLIINLPFYLEDTINQFS
jgi:hypothetical protein